MKVIQLSDYFFPFTPGGSEWSVFELSKALSKAKIDSIVVTLNYGAKNQEIIEGVKVIRMPFFKKLKDKRSVVNPFWQNNPVFMILSTIQFLKVVKKQKPDLLHVHGKYLIPAAIICGLITKKPVVVTSRDKQILCSIGKCFFDSERKTACSIWEYITVEIPWFYRNYAKDSSYLKKVYIFFGAIWSRVTFNFIKILTGFAASIVAISYSHKDYLIENGFKNVKVIYNTASFEKISYLVMPEEKTVLFAGKFTKGKGAEILLKAIKSMQGRNNLQFLIAGTIDSRWKKILINNVRFKFLGALSQKELNTAMKRANVVAMPSIYPESFGRVALESLSLGTPVVVTKMGALPEIVSNNETGKVVDPNAGSLEQGIEEVLNQEKKFRKNIKKNLSMLRQKFYEEPVKNHIVMYKSLL